MLSRLIDFLRNSEKNKLFTDNSTAYLELTFELMMGPDGLMYWSENLSAFLLLDLGKNLKGSVENGLWPFKKQLSNDMNEKIFDSDDNKI